jgi:hypothetical protein
MPRQPALLLWAVWSWGNELFRCYNKKREDCVLSFFVIEIESSNECLLVFRQYKTSLF